MDLDDQLRWHIEHSRLSRAEICKQAGIHKSSMSRLMDGSRSLHPDAMNRFCKVLELELVLTHHG